MAFLWSMGKDSTTLLHLARKAFFGTIPVPVIHIDTTYKFRQIYEFRDSLAKEWGLDLIVSKNVEALAGGMSPEKGRFECCTELKTEALKQEIRRRGFSALLVGIRRDEHAVRAKERYFSARDTEFKWDYRNQPLELWSQYYRTGAQEGEHLRIHPLLHWREIDIWRYVEAERIPFVGLYLAKGGKRFRSIGCECCCIPVDSRASTVGRVVKELESTLTPERAGRVQDKEKEHMMQKLRSLGYM
jgi:sulfate adenylyltransferase subunit 2